MVEEFTRLVHSADLGSHRRGPVVGSLAEAQEFFAGRDDMLFLSLNEVFATQGFLHVPRLLDAAEVDRADWRTTDMTTTEADAQRYVSVVRDNLKHLDAVPQLYRLLAAGEPVSVERLAAEGDWDVEDLRAELTRHPGTDWDEHGRIAGFNLTLVPTPHTFTFDGRTVYVFCADGALELPIVLGRSGVIESPCPLTGQRIRVEVTPTGVVSVDPPQAVVSKVSPTGPVDDVRAEICGLGHFIASPEAAAGWLAAHPQGQLDPVADDFQIVRQAMIELGWAADQDAQARS